MATCNQRDSAKQEQGIGGRAHEVTGNCADDQGEADADWEGNGESGDVDGRDEEQVGNVEDDSAADGPENPRWRGFDHGREERRTGVTGLTQL